MIIIFNWMSKSIIIFGANGMLGKYITKYLNMKNIFHILKITRNDIDVSNSTYDDLIKLLIAYKNAIVINCIGKIPQRTDRKQTELKQYFRINSLFPQLLYLACKETENKLIHITTDCVFSGSKGKYLENDEHDETGVYGISKSLGEPHQACIIRTSIIGEEIDNKKSLLEWVIGQNNSTIKGFKNHYWNGVTCLELAKIILFMLTHNILWEGVRHIYTPVPVSKYELIKNIIEVYNLKIELICEDTDLVDKTLSSHYDPIIKIQDILQQLNELKLFKLNT